MISLIVAKAANGAIGKGNRMPWHISGDLKYFKRVTTGGDLKYFKRVTTGHPVIMGYNTWLSLGGRPLPGRRNIVVSRSHTAAPGCGAEFLPSLEAAVAAAGVPDVSDASKEVFVIGGGQLYRAAMPLAGRLYITEVETVIGDAEVFFPEVDPELWKAESRSERYLDEKTGFYYSFLILTRK